MRVNLGSVTVGYAERRAINEYTKKGGGFASAADVRDWLRSHALADLETYVAERATDPSEEEFYAECYERDRKYEAAKAKRKAAR